MHTGHGGLIALLLACVLVSACSLVAPTDPDQAALDSLAEAGSDLSKPHPVDFYLYHREQSAAQQMCDQLQSEGFRTRLREGASGEEWLCLASSEFVPSTEALSAIQDLLAGLAERYDGEYDGWETVVVP